MSEIKRGDIYWANLEPTIGSEINKIRPVVILSISAINSVRNTIIVIPLSTSAKVVKYINIELTGGIIARCDQVRTIDKTRLKSKKGSISKKDLDLIKESIKVILGIQ